MGGEDNSAFPTGYTAETVPNTSAGSPMPTSASSTSLTLLDQLCQAGEPDRDAWAQFARLYTPLLYNRAARLGLRGADADDLIQDVIVRVLNALPGFERQGTGSFRRWLSTIISNQCNDFYRRRGRDGKDRERWASVHRGEDTPFAEIEEDEHRRYLAHRAFELLRAEFSPETAKAFELHVLDGKSAPDAARELGITANAVYLARHRVLTRLREKFREFLE